MVDFRLRSEWVSRDPITGEMVSHVPKGKKGLMLGMVATQPNKQKGGTVVIPRMTTQETLNKVPHGGKPLATIELPPNVNYAEFKRVLSAAYLAYIGGVRGDEALQATGAAPELNDVMPYVPDLLEARVKTIMGTEAFRQACEARGIAMAPRPGLTPEQDYALSIILDPTAGAGLQQRLRKAGVSMAKYRAWKRNPVFKAHVQGLADGILKEYEDDMLTTLTGLATGGDLRAIQYAFEVSGKHNPSAQQVMNSKELMIQFMTIIQKHVKDPSLLQAIGNDFMLLAGASGTVNPQPINPQPVNRVAPAPIKVIEDRTATEEQINGNDD